MRLLVLYGSQTGTAHDVAEQIWRESKCYGFSGPVLAFDENSVENLISERLVVFVVATTGDGDVPDNMKHSWRFLLRRNLPTDSLCGLRFACLGLGDSSYSKFNYAAKKLNKRLIGLGATPICPIGLCDDQHDYGLGAVALPWMTELWNTFSTELSLQKKNDLRFVYKWQLNVKESHSINDDIAPSLWSAEETPVKLTLLDNVRTTSEEHFQDVRLLRFVSSDIVDWQPGDVLQVYPSNPDKNVADFFDLVTEHKMGFDASTCVQLSSVYEEMPLPIAFRQPLSVGLVAKYIWDFSSTPRQRVFEMLAINCTDEMEREKLIEFTTAEGLDDLINYVNRPRRSLLEVLQDFRHATSKLTLTLLFELMPVIQPRSFSIASSSRNINDVQNTLDLLVAVVSYKTKLSVPRLGLCSNWLKDLQPGTVISAVIKNGTMTFPKDPSTPLIMIGPGTGIAPFRSVVQERLLEQKNGVNIGPMFIFFGCRNRKKDFHFGNDFEEWQKSNFVHSFIAFSRGQEHKVYVQHLIPEAKSEIREMIQEHDAHIYVAGSSNNMPRAVKEAFIEVFDGDAAYVDQMVKAKRYQEETWS